MSIHIAIMDETQAPDEHTVSVSNELAEIVGKRLATPSRMDAAGS